MTLTVDAPAPTSTAPTGRALVRRFRGPLAVLLVLVLALVALGIVKATKRGTLDPRSYSPAGAHAVAALLEQRGVTVTVVEDLQQLQRRLDATGAGATVFVPEAGVLFETELADIAGQVAGARAALVVGGAGSGNLNELKADASPVDLADVAPRDAQCALPVAVAAGRARTGGIAYDGAGTGCYPAGGNPTLLVLPGGTTTVIGSVSPFTNDHLGQDGNARLAVGLLGLRETGGPSTDVREVLWLLPRGDRPRPADATSSLRELVPDGIIWGVVQLFVALGVLALWRGRRLGRVVTEPLPVVVRGAEAVEGRARLYRAAGARGQAAEALRAGARDRLGRALGLPTDSGRAALVETLSARTGQDPLRVDALLFGPAPGDDPGLVRLADDLDGLHP